MVKTGKYYKVRCKNWDKETLDKIVLTTDLDMALF
nr:MAG TPA_asm: hypothetical protein [Caudoviricetes sp.]